MGYLRSLFLGLLGLCLYSLSTHAAPTQVMMLQGGWGSISGGGVLVRHQHSPQRYIDIGAGLSTTGIKVGSRYLHRFSSQVGPFHLIAGAGLGASSGISQEFVLSSSENTWVFDLSPIAYLHVTLGAYIQTWRYVFSLNTGYFYPLGHPAREIRGKSDAEIRRLLALFYGPGPVIEFGIGRILFHSN
ncbi:MAG: hypothetical protein CL521_00095 [Actinobacteria bacterium]|nr:hypothetical protein [Actinomycetota bacterium]